MVADHKKSCSGNTHTHTDTQNTHTHTHKKTSWIKHTHLHTHTHTEQTAKHQKLHPHCHHHHHQYQTEQKGKTREKTLILWFEDRPKAPISSHTEDENCRISAGWLTWLLLPSTFLSSSAFISCPSCLKTWSDECLEEWPTKITLMTM